MAGHSRRSTHCSFCGKNQAQVKRMVAGPGVYICEGCIALCNQMLQQQERIERGEPPEPGGPARSRWATKLSDLWRGRFGATGIF